MDHTSQTFDDLMGALFGAQKPVQPVDDRRVKVSFTITGSQILDTNLPHSNDEAALGCKQALIQILNENLCPDEDWVKETEFTVDVTVVDA